jgi:hypothetical protein
MTFTHAIYPLLGIQVGYIVGTLAGHVYVYFRRKRRRTQGEAA